MKDVVKNEIVNENQRKIFTKNSRKNIIKINYTFLRVNSKKYLQRKEKGLVMNKTKDIVLEKERKEKFKKLLEKICEDFGIEDSEQAILNYYNNIT